MALQYHLYKFQLLANAISHLRLLKDTVDTKHMIEHLIEQHKFYVEFLFAEVLQERICFAVVQE